MIKFFPTFRRLAALEPPLLHLYCSPSGICTPGPPLNLALLLTMPRLGACQLFPAPSASLLALRVTAWPPLSPQAHWSPQPCSKPLTYCCWSWPSQQNVIGPCHKSRTGGQPFPNLGLTRCKRPPFRLSFCYQHVLDWAAFRFGRCLQHYVAVAPASLHVIPYFAEAPFNYSPTRDPGAPIAQLRLSGLLLCPLRSGSARSLNLQSAHTIPQDMVPGPCFCRSQEVKI